MLSNKTQKRIFRDYQENRITRLNYYNYTIQYNPIADIHTWIVRQPKTGGDWEFYHPLAKSIH